MYNEGEQIAILRQILAGTGIKLDDAVLAHEIDCAKDAINLKRRHIPTPEVPLEPQYFTLQIRMAKTAVLRYGTEGQTSHGEVGIAETWESGSPYNQRDLDSIIPKGRVLYASTL